WFETRYVRRTVAIRTKLVEDCGFLCPCGRASNPIREKSGQNQDKGFTSRKEPSIRVPSCGVVLPSIAHECSPCGFLGRSTLQNTVPDVSGNPAIASFPELSSVCKCLGHEHC